MSKSSGHKNIFTLLTSPQINVLHTSQIKFQHQNQKNECGVAIVDATIGGIHIYLTYFRFGKTAKCWQKIDKQK